MVNPRHRALTIPSVILFLSGCGSPEKPAGNLPNPVPSANTSADTNALTPVCRLKLPGSWSEQSESDPSRWVFKRSDGKEQITISAMSFTSEPDLKKRTVLLDRCIELRRKAETDGAPSPITLDAVGKAINDDVCAAKFLGQESAVHRRFACLMMATPTSILTFYFEALDTPDSEFLSNAQSTLNSINLAK